MPPPVIPWDTSPRASVNPPPTINAGATHADPATFQRRMFGRNGTYTAGRNTNGRPIQVEQAPVPRPFLTGTTALRLSRRAELLDQRVNVHVRTASDPRNSEPPRLPELEGTTPIIAELEGCGPFIPELEGDAPSTTYNAVEARVVPAGTAKQVKVKKSNHQPRNSRKLFGLRPDKTEYDVTCTTAAAELAQSARDESEKKSMIDQINSCRRTQSLPPLVEEPELSSHAQHHADNAAASPPDSFIAGARGGPAIALPSPPLPNAKPDTVTTIPSPLNPSRETAARPISQRGIGAMACVERWYGGRYKEHVYHPQDRLRHREDCPCRLKICYETLMSTGFAKIGVGKGREGAGVWVPELTA